ncbi:MAG: DUF5715 family protein [Candidatus Methylomirabilia bacterium]
MYLAGTIGRKPPSTSRRSREKRAWPRVLPIAILAALTLLPSVGIAGGAVWCHQVRRGDTLVTLARRYGTSVQKLRTLNSLSRKAILRTGAMLTLPTFMSLRQGDLRLWSQPLMATTGSLARENAEADRQNLSRMRNRRMVRRFVSAGLLARLPAATRTYRVSGVPKSLRVARPWTKQFIVQLARGMHEIFGTQLKITSLTRTVATQRSLRSWNDNAAPARGGSRSTHLTGASVDISKHPHSWREIHWLRQVLRRLARKGLLHAIEEFQQPHFHVMVFKQYRSYGRALASPILIGGC